MQTVNVLVYFKNEDTDTIFSTIQIDTNDSLDELPGYIKQQLGVSIEKIETIELMYSGGPN